MRPPTPADSGGSVLGTPVVSGTAGKPLDYATQQVPGAGLLGAPVAEALAMVPDQFGHISDAGLSGGGYRNGISVTTQASGNP